MSTISHISLKYLHRLFNLFIHYHIFILRVKPLSSKAIRSDSRIAWCTLSPVSIRQGCNVSEREQLILVERERLITLRFSSRFWNTVQKVSNFLNACVSVHHTTGSMDNLFLQKQQADYRIIAGHNSSRL